MAADLSPPRIGTVVRHQSRRTTDQAVLTERHQVPKIRSDARRPTAAANAALADRDKSWGMWIRRAAMISNDAENRRPCEGAWGRRKNNNRRSDGTCGIAICTASSSSGCAASLPFAAIALHRRPLRAVQGRRLHDGGGGFNQSSCTLTRPRGRRQRQCQGQQQQGDQASHDLHPDRIAAKPEGAPRFFA